ncbi:MULTISPECIES: hypothetical protein [Calothrix]|uniref:Uncharacterized protein n=2 Tax=Calothrix TaxID=1186 RepID=A0ABR8AGK0_9CYAN|nr:MULTISPECIES: hypothetical protein [Calothrix]MBD2199161.1 hypothetical protein [Calothrix parietina FACHB-288]MBD2227863.1 hypothetical protein [Calothrix anomala FACHB-343]
MMNKTKIITTLLCIVGILNIPQKSQAIEIRGLLDEILKRGICAVVQAQSGDCAPNINTSPIPTPTTPLPDSSSPSEVPNIPTDTSSNIPQTSETSPMYNNFQEFPQTNQEVNPQDENPDRLW